MSLNLRWRISQKFPCVVYLNPGNVAAKLGFTLPKEDQSVYWPPCPTSQKVRKVQNTRSGSQGCSQGDERGGVTYQQYVDNSLWITYQQYVDSDQKRVYVGLLQGSFPCFNEATLLTENSTER